MPLFLPLHKNQMLMKTTPLFAVLTVASALAFTGCEKKPTVENAAPGAVTEAPVAKTKTFETIHVSAAIDAYVNAPSDDKAAAVDRALAELEGEIAELRERIAKASGDEHVEVGTKIQNLTEFHTKEKARYTAAKVGAAVGAVKEDADKAADTVKDGAADAADDAKDAAHDAKEAIKDAAHKTGDAVKEGAHDAKEAIKDAAKKTGETLDNAAEKAGEKIREVLP